MKHSCSTRGLFCVWLVLGGCRPTDTKSTIAPIAETPRDDAAPDDGMLPMKLVDAGQAPRRELRLAPVVGAREELLMTIDHDAERIDGRPRFSSDMPASTVVVDLMVEEVHASTHRSAFLVGYVPTAGGEATFARGELVVDDRGRALDFWIEFLMPGPDGTLQVIDPSARAGGDARTIEELHRFLVPLPAEPVGVGAKWTTEESVEDSGVAITLVSTYELLAIGKGGVEIRATQSSRFEGGAMTGPGGAMKVNAIEVRGDRTVFLADGHVMPQQTALLVNEMDLEQRGERMAARTTESVILRPVEDAELAAFSPEAAALLHTGTPMPALCKSLRGDRNGRFPRASGPARVVGECTAGKMTGTWTSWHADGKHKHVEGSFDGGAPAGRWTQWSADGKELGTFELDAGKGTVVQWWPNGGKRLEVGFKNGVPEGALATWREDGKADVRGRFVAGRRDGVWEQLGTDGKVVDHTTNDHACRVVVSVTPDSAAMLAGVEKGDIITALGKTKIADGSKLRDAVTSASDGPIALVVLRDGKSKTLKPKLVGGKLGVQLGCSLHVVEHP